MTTVRPNPDGVGYPLRMTPTFDPKPWGGRRLEAFGKALPDGAIGESLESGSGSTVANGPLAGWTLGELARAVPAPLLGTRGVAASGPHRDFPLLIKLIDAHETLSVQVHPDDEHAPPGKRGKTEAWLILRAEPGAGLVVGIDSPLDVERVEDQIVFEEVQAGDVFFVPAGTIHAIGAGVLLYEAQQASDVTYRVYDWGRPRETHREDAARVTRHDRRATRSRPLALDDGREILVACRHFAVERWAVDGDVPVAADPDTFRVVTVLGGALSIAGHDARSGDTFVLPADLPDCDMRGNGVALVAYIPDLERDVLAPLRAAGHSQASIDALGAGA